MKKHNALRIVWGVLCSFMTCGVVFATEGKAADYPLEPVHLIVPYPAGGGADYWARIVATQLAGELGQSIIVDNIPGAGGNNGTAAAAAASPDGYTLLLGSVGPLAVHPYTYTTLAFDPLKDFVPIALLESSPIVLVANPTVQPKSGLELIEFARAHPGSLTYASNGNGSPEQVAGELFKKRLQIDIRHLPYGGAGPARKAVLAGEAGLMFDPCKGALPAIHKGLQSPLAVAARTRLASLPAVPTFGELGVANYELRIWTGIFAPAGTPREIVVKLNKTIRLLLQSAALRKEIAAEGGEAGAMTPRQFEGFLRSERKQWQGLVTESGVSKVL